MFDPLQLPNEQNRTAATRTSRFELKSNQIKAEPQGIEGKGDGFPPHLGILPWGVGSRGGKGKVAHKEQQEEAAHRDNYSYVRGWLFL
jgi:hypothetical protein